MVKKRPAAAQPDGPVAKKPASWQSYADDEDGADGQDSEKPDASSLTKTQRYLFDRALKSGELPPEVQAKREAIRQDKNPGYPKQLNAVVNSIIPKTVAYASKVDYSSPAALKRFEGIFRVQKVSHQQAARACNPKALTHTLKTTLVYLLNLFCN